MSVADASRPADPELRSELRATARSFLEESATIAVARRALAEGTRPVALEHDMADLGWLGVEVPEEHGGLGLGFGELAVILHELGRLVSPSAFATVSVLGIGALAHARPDQQAEWLPRLAAGTATVTAALTGPGGVPGTVGIEARRTGGGWELNGTGGFVPDLGSADAVAVAARGGPDGRMLLFLVRTAARGVTCEPVATSDATRRLAHLHLSAVAAGEEDALAGVDRAADVVSLLLERAAVAVALDCVGGAERVLELTVEHLRSRYQFGRALGSFQALKHRAADMLLALEASRSAAEHAAERVAARAGGDGAASIAKSYAGDAYVHVAAEGVQLHGGIGYTWEHDLHRYLKRARLDQVLFGSSAWHRDRLAAIALAGSRNEEGS